MSFLFQSSFLNQFLFTDHSTKISNLDVMLIQSNLTSNSSNQLLYNAFMYDSVTLLNICNFSNSPLLQSEYQEPFNVTLILAPELLPTFSDFYTLYVASSTINVLPSAVFDSYSNNLNFFYGEGCVHFFLFFLYVYFIIYFFSTLILLKWVSFTSSHFMRFYYFFYSISKETRIQFEAVTQTMVFFLIYWGMVIMAFDDDQEEVIEFIDTSFFNFLTIIILFLCYKFSIHYFAFLDCSVAEGRSVTYIATQFIKDFLNTFSLILRFYVLVFRINIYDIFDDILDSYYVFIIDFDDDEYINELFLSIHGTLFFTNDNHDYRSILLEDENGFVNDLFYLYFLT